jgi:uncharacterized UPF0160 family protein
MFGRLKDVSYRSAAAVMKRNFIGMGKKYKDDKEVQELIAKVNKAIDEHDKDYIELTKELKQKMAIIDIGRKQKGHKFVCIYPTCNESATVVNISEAEHVVFCDKHYKDYLKLRKKTR